MNTANPRKPQWDAEYSEPIAGRAGRTMRGRQPGENWVTQTGANMLIKTLVWALGVVACLAVLLVVAGQIGLLQGTAPASPGVREGRLKPPSATPNSVSSQAALYPEHAMRGYAQIAPLALRGDGAASLARLRRLIEAMPGAKIVKSEPDYLYAQFTTRLLRFVDDAEFWFDPAAGAIQVRSASRLGRKDLGVNRERIEAIRAQLAAQP